MSFALFALLLISEFYVPSVSLSFTQSWGRKTIFQKFIENSSFGQEQKHLGHFAQHDTTIHLGKKVLGVIGSFKSTMIIIIMVVITTQFT